VKMEPTFDVETNPDYSEVEAGPLFGASIHSELGGRNSPNQHPIEAITGLQQALDSKQEKGEFATKQELEGKQDTIEDLEAIREGAELGATAVQPNALNEYATKQELGGKQDKGDYALKSQIPKKVGELENDKGYLTEHQDISGLATKQELAEKQDFIQDLPAIRAGSASGATAVQPSTLSGYATKKELGEKQDVIPDLSQIRQGASKGETAVQPATLNNYATKQALTEGLASKQPVGDYATKQELNGKQDTIGDLAKIRQGAELGETAVQPADIPVKDVQANGTSLLADGIANIPIAAAGGKLGLVFPAGFGIGVTATGALAINKATDALLLAKTNNFQPVVPSNLDSAMKIGLTTNAIILTGTEKATACNWLGAQQISTIQALNATDSITLTDGYIYNGGEQTALTIALPTYADVSFLCEIDFTSGATATTLTYPQSGIIWLGDDISNNVFAPVVNKRYTVMCAYDGVNYRFAVKGV
jgi:hypothetical protein